MLHIRWKIRTRGVSEQLLCDRLFYNWRRAVR